MSGLRLNNHELKSLFRKRNVHADDVTALIKMSEQNGDCFDFFMSEGRCDLAGGNENAVLAHATTEQLIEVQADIRLNGIGSEYGMSME